MKKLSIKLRMTLWYTLLMLIISALMLGFMLTISGSVAESAATKELAAAIADNAGEVEYDDGELEIDDDFLPLSNGIYSALYTEDHVLVYGQVPAGFTADIAFESGGVRTVEQNGRSYYVYDMALTFQGYGTLFLRGVMAADSGAAAVNSIIRTAFITLPLIVALAALGGYFIARRSLRPVEDIRRAADDISEGGDLNTRIDIGKGKDEIHRLAATFNRMFSRLEGSFLGEKQFTSDASHELRTPTAVILAQCEYALACAQTPEEYREAIEVIHRQASRMSRLIAQLLAFTRMERGLEVGDFARENVSELVSLICEEQAAANGRGIRMFTDIEPGIHARIERTLFSRLLINLISNAYKYGKDGGTVRVAFHAANGEATLSVADDGIGISAEDQAKVFRRFYQANPSRTPEENGGMGLGLAMVEQAARLHGGRVALTSEPGRGSVFTVVFPLM